MLAVSRGDAELGPADGEYVIVPHEFFDSSEAGLMALRQKLCMVARAAIGSMLRMDGLIAANNVSAASWRAQGSRAALA